MKDIILTNELAIRLAAESIENKQILSDVKINVTRYYSSIDNEGSSAYEAYKMIDSHINAVIGDVSSRLTKASASMTGLWKIPQCSSTSGSFTFSDISNYPYFFRTVGTSASHMNALAHWVKKMGWQKFSILYTNDALGQEVYTSIATQAYNYNLTIENDYSFLQVSEDIAEEALQALSDSGSRIIIMAFSRVYEQLVMLRKANELGYISKGWVWMVSNDDPIAEYYNRDNMTSFDGVMFINNLWNLTGVPAYDELYQKWQAQPVPANFSNPTSWNSTSLSYNVPQAYSCLELFALGIDKALDQYPGGRSQGLVDLANHSFNSTTMLPPFYNMNFTGPAWTINTCGKMEFSKSGDLQDGNFQIFYLLGGNAITYANVKSGFFEFIPGIDIIYPGNTMQKPIDIAEQIFLNPSYTSATGIAIIVICAVGIFFCILMTILIFSYRHLKPIMISSPVFCYLELLGTIVCYLSALLSLGKPNPPICIARAICLFTGFILVVGSIIAKNYRIYKIYQNVFSIRTSRLKSSYLLRIVAAFEFIALVPFVIWNAIYPVNIETYQTDYGYYCWYCRYPTAQIANWGMSNAVIVLEIAWVIILIFFSALIAFKTRSVNSKWSEATQIAYISYNLGVTATVMVPSFLISNDDYTISFNLFICSLLFDSEEQDHMSIHSSNSMDQNIQLKLVAKNMYDFTTQAHEGILPVKKMAKLDFLSIWMLKRIILVPFKRYFILTDKSGQNASVYNYAHCEAASTGHSNHYTFRVRTDKGLYFLFQVYDNESLNRWISWFNHDPNDRIQPKGIRPLRPAFTPERSQQQIDALATFGNGAASPTTFRDTGSPSNLRQDPSVSLSSYPTTTTAPRFPPTFNGFTSSTHASFITDGSNNNTGFNETSGTNQLNSFGVITDTSRQRYP
ncbi:hypothetical protein G6F41_008677 [Rhizopus arrhizus]|nr:hypothetical protein G6F41_008677 [Rhizopus arrhizus]